MYIFEILPINEVYAVDADVAVCCVPTGQFLFVLLFGQIPHSSLQLPRQRPIHHTHDDVIPLTIYSLKYFECNSLVNQNVTHSKL